MADEQDGWHERAVNPLLITHFLSLNVPPGGRVFFPLCGKSLDLGWLWSRGHAVAGAELNELAVTHLFAELGMEPHISEGGKHKFFSGKKIDIFVGDFLTCLAKFLAPSMRFMTGPHWLHYRRRCGPVHDAFQSCHGLAPTPHRL